MGRDECVEEEERENGRVFFGGARVIVFLRVKGKWGGVVGVEARQMKVEGGLVAKGPAVKTVDQAG